MFAALVTANHTKPGGRMRKLALDFCLPNSDSSPRLNLDCSAVTTKVHTGRLRNLGSGIKLS